MRCGESESPDCLRCVRVTQHASHDNESQVNAEVDILGRTSIYHLVRSGQLKPIRIGGAVRFDVDHLREFVNSQATE
jgi:hypothetical protein